MPSVVFADMVFDFQMKMATKGGNPEAEFKVGEMYETGFGVKMDMAEADKWITKAANQGHETAGFKLLYWDVEKNGINRTNEVKVSALKVKAEAGNPQAQYYVGKMHANGVGWKQDSDKAIKWLSKAAFVGVLAAEREMTSVREAKDKLDLARKNAVEKKRAQQRAQKEIEQKAKIDAQRKLEAQKQTDAASREKNQLAEKSRIQAETDAKNKQRAEVEKAEAKKVEAEKAEAKRLALVKKQQDEKNKEDTKSEFDPCGGKKARFMSTCR